MATQLVTQFARSTALPALLESNLNTHSNPENTSVSIQGLHIIEIAFFKPTEANRLLSHSGSSSSTQRNELQHHHQFSPEFLAECLEFYGADVSAAATARCFFCRFKSQFLIVCFVPFAIFFDFGPNRSLCSFFVFGSHILGCDDFQCSHCLLQEG